MSPVKSGNAVRNAHHDEVKNSTDLVNSLPDLDTIFLLLNIRVIIPILLPMRYFRLFAISTLVLAYKHLTNYQSQERADDIAREDDTEGHIVPRQVFLANQRQS